MNAATRHQYEALLELVRARTGLVFPESRLDGVAEAVRASMAAAGVTDFATFRLGLGRDAAFADFIDRLLVGETYFYRDPTHFWLVRDVVLPAIERRKGRRQVLAWSAGCATGEEPYTLAMVLADSGFGDESRILATDLSTASLHKARRGCYRPWSLRGTALARRHLAQEDGQLCVAPALKRMIDFRALNLAEPGWPSAETGTLDRDLILCRNVLIYLAPDAIAAIARRLYDALTDEGWLILGPSDPPLDGLAPFTVEVRDEAIVYRRGVARATRPTPLRASTRPKAPPRRRTPSRPLRAVEPKPQQTQPQQTQPQQQSKQQPQQTQPQEADDAAMIRALAYRDGTPAAERALRAELERRPLVAELHYLHALLLTDVGRIGDAIEAVRRVIYLAPDIVVAHVLMATLQRRRGALADAQRALRVAASLLSGQPADALIRLGDGQRAGQFASLVERELGDLGAAP